MRKPFRLLPAAACLAALSACTATPARQALVAHDLATIALESVTSAADARLLDPDDLRTLAPAVAALRAAQQSLALSAQSNASPLDTHLQALHEATLALLIAREAAIASRLHKE